MTKLFDERRRDDDSPMRNRESQYAFYDRSARIEISRVRDRLELLFDHYPDCEKGEVRARIRSGNDRNFSSAVFEIALHELLLLQGCELECHPRMATGVETRPDFLVHTPEGGSFYLEAVLASEANERNQGAEARKGALMDVLNAVPHRNFMVSIHSEGSPHSQPSGKLLARQVHEWLDRLDPNQIAQQMEADGFDSIDELSWTYEDWVLRIRPIPLKEDCRGKASRLIGVGGGKAGWIDHWSPIRDALRKKGSRYGRPDRPFVIAVNFDIGRLDRRDEMQALFGQEQYSWHVGDAETEPDFGRARNGFWVSGAGPRYRRVSGAWIFAGLEPSRLANCGHTVYVNPWGDHPIPEELLVFPHATADGETMEWREGQSIRDVFELSEPWPE